MNAGLYNFYKSSMKWENSNNQNNVVAEYIWIDGTGINLRSKQRTLQAPITSIKDIPEWNYDGSSTYQAHTSSSEVILKPRAIFQDPFRKGNNILVMCDTFVYEDRTFQKLTPANTNFRHFANQIFEKINEEEGLLFNIKQQYTLFTRVNTNSRWPLGWPKGGFPNPEGPYYCSVGANCNFGRKINEALYRCCLHAGIQINSTKADVMPGQWELEIGPCKGTELGDHLWMARYILGRICENSNLTPSFEPQPVGGKWHAASCHTVFSTVSMRCKETSLKTLQQAVMKLDKRNDEHLLLYGDKTKSTHTGIMRASSFSKLETTPGTKESDIRIKGSALIGGKIEIEDRRPSSNSDPYLIAAALADTICLNKEKSEVFHELMNHCQAFIEWKKGQAFDKIIAN